MPINQPSRRIHKLPGHLVSQIAAGEVIERPASVVKELLENSLDAGATTLQIDIERGGSRLIHVTDNGHGIHRDDLKLAIDTHTTSKLFTADDLWRINTLGFRGEALSSIASVSRFTLTSRQSGDDHGYMLRQGRQPDEFEIVPAPHSAGTTVEIRDLFYATPVRRKFMRSERTEFIHIHEWVKRIALSRYDIALQLTHNGRQILALSPADPVDRIAAVLGKPFTRLSVMVNEQTDNMSLQGWSGLPAAARSQTDQQYFYLNGRCIRDKLISHAMRLAFQDHLYPGRQPVYVLHLQMDTAAFDINVHPAKQEVRFRDARAVHDFIYGSVRRQLDGANSIAATAGNRISEDHTNYKSVYKQMPDQVFPPAMTCHEHVHETGALMVDKRYLVAKDNGGVLLIDIARARTWIALSKLRRSASAGEIKTRPVLVPLLFSVTADEAELIEQHQTVLEQTGLVIHRSGPGSLTIRALPALLPHIDAGALLKDMLKQLKQDNATDAMHLVIAQHANDGMPVIPASDDLDTLLTDLRSLKVETNDAEWFGICRHIRAEELQKLLHAK